ncbi:MAG: protein translocase subunit SecD [Actinomycetes bacterium]
MRQHPLRQLILTMVVAYGLLIATVVAGRSPKLGLDLQGGISVNLQPVRNGKVVDNVKPEQLDEAIAIIRKRVDALGVAEPEVSRQGNTITVQLPGAKNQQQVLDVVGKTAELRFRPVLQLIGQVPTGAKKVKAKKDVAKLRKQLKLPDGVTAEQVATDEQAQAAQTPATSPGQVTSTPSTTAPSSPASTAAPGTTADPTAGSGRRSPAVLAQKATTTTTAKPPASTTTTTAKPVAKNKYKVDVYDTKFAELYQLEQQLSTQTTPPSQDVKNNEVTLVGRDGTVYKLGPTQLTGRAVETASAGLGQTGEWTVNPVFRKGKNGIDLFNKIAAKCFAGDPVCPATQPNKGQLAIVLDSQVLSAPSINEPSFSRDRIQISGSFSEEEAKSLAVALRFGSLPVELKPQQAETVSATLGKGALKAGLIAGLIGLLLVAAYLLLYYRMLGLATVGALTVSASLLWVIMANLSATVTLAGVVGIVVSIGISLDSSVVFFESIKEDVRNGASLRSSVEKSFSSAYSTIVKADMSSLIGAVVLYWLSIGPVRGFAFYLGVATLLDLVAAYFFLRPAVVLLARSKQGGHPERFGIPTDDLAATANAAAHGGTAVPATANAASGTSASGSDADEPAGAVD